MCESLADGGRRCAAATRPAFERALGELSAATSMHEHALIQCTHMEAVVAHAASRTGASQIAQLIASPSTGRRLRGYLEACLATAHSLDRQREAVEAAVVELIHRRSRPATLFHVTTDTAWETIQEEGLRPTCKDRSSAAAEQTPRVFLFGSRQDVDNALGNWLGEEFEDHDGDLVIIEMQTPDDAEPTFPGDETSWEWSTSHPIAAAALRAVDRC